MQSSSVTRDPTAPIRVAVHKASGCDADLLLQATEPLTAKIVGQWPHKEASDLMQAEAQAIYHGLQAVLPGGTLDRLAVIMMQQLVSNLVIRKEQP